MSTEAPRKACPCRSACLHCQFCWAAGRAHPEFGSTGGLGSHMTSHGRKPQPARPPVRALDRGERGYVRKRLEFAVLQLAAELHCTPETIAAAIPQILREPRRTVPPVPRDECLQTGPGILVGMRIKLHPD